MRSLPLQLLLVLFACDAADALMVATVGRRDAMLGLLLAANAPPGGNRFDDNAKLFESSCAACHAGGGNIVARRGKTLKLADLTKNGYDDTDSLVAIIADGKGSMPGFGELCAPKMACTLGQRLSNSEIRDLASYVLAQAAQGWGGP